MAERPVHEHIGQLSESLVNLARGVTGNFFQALVSLRESDEEMARGVKSADRRIDEARIQLESQCLSFLALQQPVARDLRTVVAVMKIGDDLERIGDLSVHLVERVPDIGSELQTTYGIQMMGTKVGEMLKLATDAFAFRDASLANRIESLEQEIDVIHRNIVKRVMSTMQESSSRNVDLLTAVLSLSRYLERIADHASRIAREVIYLVTGQSPRPATSAYEKLFDLLKN